MFDSEDHVNSWLGSPGMEYLIDEQMEAEKRIPKNVKFNKAFDISKVCAEYIKDTSNEQFDMYIVHEMF